MKKFLLIQLFLGCIIPVNAGIYYYPFYQNGIKVRCGDNQPRHLISFKAGRAMLFEDDGDEKYKFSGTFYSLRNLTRDLSTFQVQQVPNAVLENYLKKKGNSI